MFAGPPVFYQWAVFSMGGVFYLVAAWPTSGFVIFRGIVGNHLAALLDLGGALGLVTTNLKQIPAYAFLFGKHRGGNRSGVHGRGWYGDQQNLEGTYRTFRILETHFDGNYFDIYFCNVTT